MITRMLDPSCSAFPIVPLAFVVMVFQPMEHVLILPSVVLWRVHVINPTGPVEAGPTAQIMTYHVEGEL